MDKLEILGKYGYKKSGDNKIIKIKPLGINNLNRKVKEMRYAKYRCERAEVLEIYDMHDPNIKYDTAISEHNANFIYKVGEIAEADAYDPYEDIVCSHGIHFYTSEFAAFYHSYEVTDGEQVDFYENGQTYKKYQRSKGKIDGKYEEWYKGGELAEIGMYKDGKPVGICETFHPNGAKKSRRMYSSNDNDDSFLESWNVNGEKVLNFGASDCA